MSFAQAAFSTGDHAPDLQPAVLVSLQDQKEVYLT